MISDLIIEEADWDKYWWLQSV